MYERRLCTEGHLTTFTYEEERPVIGDWACPICSSHCAWGEYKEQGTGNTPLTVIPGSTQPRYVIPVTQVTLEIGKWYKRKDSPYLCVGLNGMGEYPAILQTASGYLEAVKLNGETTKGLPFKPCSAPHDCKNNMLVTAAGVDVQKGRAVIQVMAQCSCGKSWKGKTHIKEVK